MQGQHLLTVGASIAVLTFWQAGIHADTTSISASEAAVEVPTVEPGDLEVASAAAEPSQRASKSTLMPVSDVSMRYQPDTQDWLMRLALNDLRMQQVMYLGYPGWPVSQVGTGLAFDLGLREPLAYESGLPWPTLEYQRRSERGNPWPARRPEVTAKPPQPIFRVDPQHDRLVVSHTAAANSPIANPIAPMPNKVDEPRLSSSSVQLPQAPSAPMPTAIWAGLMLFIGMAISRVRAAGHAAKT